MKYCIKCFKELPKKAYVFPIDDVDDGENEIYCRVCAKQRSFDIARFIGRVVRIKAGDGIKPNRCEKCGRFYNDSCCDTGEKNEKTN